MLNQNLYKYNTLQIVYPCMVFIPFYCLTTQTFIIRERFPELFHVKEDKGIVHTGQKQFFWKTDQG